jgi:hypothetical protein
LFGSRLF